MKLSVNELKCEYRENPLGISEQFPRFSWKIFSDGYGINQKFYRIRVVNGEKALREERYVWDSGKTQSECPFAVRYQGEPLKPQTVYFWFVEVWDNCGNFAVSEIACFETGLFSLAEWKSRWITAKESEHCIHTRASFILPNGKSVVSARLYSASTAGAFGDVTFAMNTVYLTMNGKKVGKDAMMPGQISSRRWRAVYRTYDITDLLSEGENVVGVVLVSMAYSAIVSVRFSDGSSEEYLLGDLFKVNGRGPYTLWDVGVGEHGGKTERYDSFAEYKGFDEPNFDDSGWSTPVYTNVVACLEEQTTTVEEIEVLKPILVKDKWEGHYLVDFGQVIHGHIRLIIENPKKKERVSVVYAEGIYPNEQLDFYSTINYHHGENGPHYDAYITKGNEKTEFFEPRFSNHSFRYVDVFNYPGELKAENIFAVVIHSPVLCASNFTCSDEEINRLFAISRWSQRDNLVAIPTDCPARERLGWMGDAWVCAEAEMLDFDLRILMESWCRTIKDDQEENGYVPFVCPPPNLLTGVDVPWSAACIFVPWFVYERYGDLKILSDMYPVMEKWIDFMGTLANENYELIGGIMWSDHTQQQPRSDSKFLAMAYYCLCCDYMVKVCMVLGKDCEKYARLAQKIRESILGLYQNGNGIASNTQGELSHALALDLIDRTDGIKRLEENLISTQSLIKCGCLGIYHLITELGKSGRHDIIYNICKCDRKGSFLSWIKNHDATTAFEFLRYYGSASKNHPFLMGSVTAWFYQGLAGIKNMSPGYRSFDIEPYLPQGMEFVQATVETNYGDIKVKCQKIDTVAFYELNIPCGTTACLYLTAASTPCVKNEKDQSVYDIREKDGKRFILLESGTYLFKI